MTLKRIIWSTLVLICLCSPLFSQTDDLYKRITEQVDSSYQTFDRQLPAGSVILEINMNSISEGTSLSDFKDRTISFIAPSGSNSETEMGSILVKPDVSKYKSYDYFLNTFYLVSDLNRYQSERKETKQYLVGSNGITSSDHNQRITVAMTKSFVLIFANNEMVAFFGTVHDFTRYKISDDSSSVEIHILNEDFDSNSIIAELCVQYKLQQWEKYPGTCLRCLDASMNQGDWQSATLLVNQIISGYENIENPSHYLTDNSLQPLGYYYLKKIEILKNSGKYDEAIKNISAVLKDFKNLGTQKPEFYYAIRAGLLEKLGRNDAALANHMQVVKGDSSYKSIMDRALFKKRNDLEYETDMNVVIQMIKGSLDTGDSYLESAKFYTKLNLYSKAEREYSEGIEKLNNQNWAAIHLRLLRARMREARNDAMGAAEDMVAIARSRWSLTLEDSIDNFLSRNPDLAFAHLAKGILLYPSSQRWPRRIYEQKLDSARSFILKSVKNHSSYEANFYLALISRDLKNLDESIGYANSARSLNFSGEVLQLLSELHFLKNSFLIGFFYDQLYHWNRTLIIISFFILILFIRKRIQRYINDFPEGFNLSKTKIVSSHGTSIYFFIIYGWQLAVGILLIVMGYDLSMDVAKDMIEWAFKILFFVVFVGACIWSMFFGIMFLSAYKVLILEGKLVKIYSFFNAMILIDFRSIKSIHGVNVYHKMLNKVATIRSNSSTLTIYYGEGKILEISSMHVSNFEKLREILSNSTPNFTDDSTAESINVKIRGKDIVEVLLE